MFQFAPGCTVNGKPIKDDEKAALNVLQDSMSIASSSPNWTSAEHNGVIIEGTPEFLAMIMGSNKMPTLSVMKNSVRIMFLRHTKRKKRKSRKMTTRKRKNRKRKSSISKIRKKINDHVPICLNKCRFRYSA